MRKLLEAHDPPYGATGHLPHAPEHQLAVGPAAGPHIIAAPYGQLTAGDLASWPLQTLLFRSQPGG